MCANAQAVGVQNKAKVCANPPKHTRWAFNFKTMGINMKLVLPTDTDLKFALFNHFNNANLWKSTELQGGKRSFLSFLIRTIKSYEQTQFPVYFLCHMQLQWTGAQIISFQPFNPNQILTREWYS